MGLISGKWRGGNLLANGGGPGPKKPPNPNRGGKGLGRGGRGRGGGGAPDPYILQATYTTNTVAEYGSITYTETDGSIDASGGVADITAQTTPSWGDLSWWSQNTSINPGYVFIFTINGPSNEDMYAGWGDGVGSALSNFTSGMSIGNSNTVMLISDGAAEIGKLSTISGSSDERFAVLLGGYDANKVPMDSASNIASYGYGCALFQYEGTNWELLYRISDVDHADQTYAGMSFYDYSGTYDYPIIPNVDLSSLLVPKVLDTFTDTNGTAIASHTPDIDTVGNGWSTDLGSWTIESNKAMVAQSGESRAIIDTGESDAMWEATTRSSYVDSSNRQSHFFFCRYVDGDNWWGSSLNSSNGSFILYERTSGTSTSRASATMTAYNKVDNVYARFVLVAKGTTIKAMVGDLNSTIEYASASANQTATKMAFYTNQAGTSTDYGWDNVGVYPRGTGGEYNVLGDY